MAKGNIWEIEGNLSKKEWAKRGTSRIGKPYLIQSISIYAGKDKETGKSKYERVSFFVPDNDIERFESMPDGTKLRLRGKPIASAYTNKEGELISQLNLQPDWENWVEVLPAYQPQENQEQYSSDPF